jgi:hypothetical protein
MRQRIIWIRTSLTRDFWREAFGEKIFNVIIVWIPCEAACVALEERSDEAGMTHRQGRMSTCAMAVVQYLKSEGKYKTSATPRHTLSYGFFLNCLFSF